MCLCCTLHADLRNANGLRNDTGQACTKPFSCELAYASASRPIEFYWRVARARRSLRTHLRWAQGDRNVIFLKATETQ